MKPAGPSLAALFAASIAGCIVDFHPAKVCGDGYVDELAHEECDPAAPNSYTELCAELGGLARDSSPCDPSTCEFVAEACDLCGNGALDPGEECELGDLGGAICPGDAGTPTCRGDCTVDYSGCTACGDGVVNGDEECDPAIDDILTPVPCADLVSPGGVTRKYGSGSSTRCTAKCLYDRSACSYCKNHQLDGEFPVDFEGMITLAAEICDEDRAQPDMLEQHCRAVCGSNYSVECSYKCADDCRDFDVSAISQADLGCCTSRGEECPYVEGTKDLKPGRFPCCWAEDNPDDAPCQEGPNSTLVCR